MRLLFLTPRFPYPPHKGDVLRAYHQLRTLGREHAITLLSMADRPVAPEHLAHVQRLCERVEVVPLSRLQVLRNLGVGLLSRLPLQVRYHHSEAFQGRLEALRREHRFDAIHVTLMRMLPYVEGVQDTPVVLDLIDSLTLNLEGRRTQVRGVKRLAYELEYRRVRDYERNVVSRRTNLVVSSPADQRLFGEDAASVIPNGVDVDAFRFQGAEGRRADTLIFTGNMGYQPNEEAVLWFAHEVMPRLRAVRPGVLFRVVGMAPSERVRALASRDVEVTGPVADMGEALRDASVAVCPMRSGSGIQNKVLEAMAVGTPVVSSAIANRGVNGVDGRDLLVRDDPEGFARAVLQLLGDAGLRQRLGQAGRDYVEHHFRWERHAERLASLYAAPAVGT
ncbi:glycosyltransferase [Aggregicoccus sp. 17bor-14]|uniref:glycosyltransferase n=1 Tax=Myxococcaceae TaxID=31 RepID=UPI00129C39A1|nr:MULTISPECIES: glycosyltransferase [Myxococcaceae]MBF5042900.1 glycosyltransferase [Simulacricoccus sp. 17bor-14]MRI88667.1 glycosyltransferase [Aggregicoccus sp. 17bor-14]